jgi:hypothetical protein
MKKTFFLLILSFPAPFIWAQPTQAEIDKALKRAQQEIEKMKTDPKMKDMIKRMPNLDSLSKFMPKNALLTVPKNTFRNPAYATLPPRNDKLLNTIPRKNLSRQELINFLVTLHASLEKNLPPAKVQAAGAIVAKLNKNAAKIAQAGALAWYKNAPA